jgi:hypothetical protein
VLFPTHPDLPYICQVRSAQRASVKNLPTVGDAGIREKIDKLFAGIEHPGLHRALRDPDHLCDLFDRLFVIVEEVDDFTMDRRELGINCAEWR